MWIFYKVKGIKMTSVISKEDRKQQLIQEYLQSHGANSADPEDISDDLMDAAHKHADDILNQEGYN
jgi:hypothetical protein